MMASSAYQEWLDAGQPYTPARPVADFVNVLRGKGFLVYHKGNTAHMTAEPPEDHTPFSATGWPIPSARWIGHALDIMPTGAPIPLPDLARQIIRDKENHVKGTGWIKYLNWTDEALICRHESWANPSGTRVTTLSSDKGHIHISARSDMDTSSEVSDSGYYPGGNDMAFGPDEEYKLHVINYRIDAILSGKDPGNVPAFTASTGQKFPALSTNNATVDSFSALSTALAPTALASAFAAALIMHPEIVEALANAVVAQVGKPVTADDLTNVLAATVWRTTVAA